MPRPGDDFWEPMARRLAERRVAGVWLGNAAPSAPMAGVSGGGLPARIWRAIMVDAARA